MLKRRYIRCWTQTEDPPGGGLAEENLNASKHKLIYNETETSFWNEKGMRFWTEKNFHLEAKSNVCIFKLIKCDFVDTLIQSMSSQRTTLQTQLCCLNLFQKVNVEELVFVFRSVKYTISAPNLALFFKLCTWKVPSPYRPVCWGIPVWQRILGHAHMVHRWAWERPYCHHQCGLRNVPNIPHGCKFCGEDW